MDKTEWTLDEIIDLLKRQWKRGKVSILEGNVGISISIEKISVFDKIDEQRENCEHYWAIQGMKKKCIYCGEIN